MNITAAINIPCVSQTNLWKGCFEAHFMSGREIDVKYPILNINYNKITLSKSCSVVRIVYSNFSGIF